MAKNSFKAWAFKEPGGHLVITDVYQSKTEAIDSFTGLSIGLVDDEYRQKQWREARANGWRIVPVLVTEIGEPLEDFLKRF